MTVTDRTNSREVAFDALTEILEKGGYSHLVLRQALEKYQYLEKQDRAFITKLTEGTVEYVILLDAVLDRFSKVKVKKMKPAVRTVLRMSVYQILFLDRVPDSAVCNEAVKLMKKRKLDGLSGFVNGVLRTVSREKGTLSFPDPSVRLSMPRWILSMWERDYGKETAETMAASFLSERKLSVRCNLSLASKEQILESLRRQEIGAEETEYSNSVLFLTHYDFLEQVEAFQRGWITVQDLSSVLSGAAAEPKPGDFVLDICGAPGGKGLHLADLLNGSGTVEIRDLTEAKIMQIQENLARCGFQNVRTKAWDARVFDEIVEEKADIVLADLPCSGLGIIGKKPDIKLRVMPEDLDSLQRLQREILTAAVRYVKPGGTLVYSTCTVDKKENGENVSWLLEQFPLREKDLAAALPAPLKDAAVGGTLQLLPGIHPCDGFFIAVFEKK